MSAARDTPGRGLGLQHDVREEGYAQNDRYQKRHAQYVHETFFFVRFQIEHDSFNATRFSGRLQSPVEHAP